MSPPPAPEWLAAVGRDLLDLTVPQRCAGCDRPGRPWCSDCAASVRGPSLVVAGELTCRAAAAHAGPPALAVVAFKDRGLRTLADPLGALLAGAVLDLLADATAGPGDPVWLVPVPARRAARRSRGTDHMVVLAGRAARLLRARGVPAHRCAALRHVRDSRDQVGLTRDLRRANVEGTLAAGPVPGGLLVLVDDVTTTGATLAEAARALRVATGRTPMAATVTCAGTTPHLASRGPRD
jgi:predicted amidophosphoribosyltransferase